MTKSDKYEVQGDGPYFIREKATKRLVSMISFMTEAEAQAFIDMLDRSKG